MVERIIKKNGKIVRGRVFPKSFHPPELQPIRDAILDCFEMKETFKLPELKQKLREAKVPFTEE